MKLINRSIVTGAMLALLAVGLASAASAADVRAELSTRETYVGLPITLQVQVSNASSDTPPTIPSVDGLEIKPAGAPARSTQITTINGQVSTSSSVTYAYQVTAQRTGSFRIPPITIQVGGRAQQTRALDLIASKSETGDLLFVEIAGKTKEIFVGQSLDLTLNIWLRPFRDRERGITLSEADMWRMISDRSSWGSFSERVAQLADANQRPGGKETIRKDSSGVEHSYYLYQINATIYPKKPGKIDGDDVKIVVDYPTALGQSRDPFSGFFGGMSRGRSGQDDDEFFSSPFGSRLVVQSVRPIVATASVEPIQVMPIPTANMPADYRGAVGKYHVAVQASPSNVKAGDPINLLIGIAGTGPMDLVQAPPLADLRALTTDFKVPNEPLAGFAKGEQKVFSTEIRPRKAGITHVPSIPFTYFDPDTAKFVTVHSEPVAIQVAPADTLALDAVVGHGKESAASPEKSQAANAVKGGPTLANFTGNELLKSEPASLSISWPLAVLFAVPPIAVLGLLVSRRRLGGLGLSSLFASSARRFHTQVENAETSAEVAALLQAFLKKQLRLNPNSADAADIAGVLRSTGDRKLAIRCERLLQDCTRPAVGGLDGGPTLAQLKRDALEVSESVKEQRHLSRSKPAPVTRKASGVRPASTVVTMFALAAAVLVASGSVQAAEPQSLSPPDSAVSDTSTEPSVASLTVAQQATLLSEANAIYNQALVTANKDSADAKQDFSNAAEKYQVLLDSGVRNSRLFVNAANAYLQSGQTGRAVANYRRALQIDPTSSVAKTNLAYAESLTKPAASEPNAKAEYQPISAYLSARITG